MFKALLWKLFRSSRRRAKITTVSTWRVTSVKIDDDRSAVGQKTNRTLSSDILEGKCHVIDGDTIVIKGTKIRLAGIDAPELDQPWGKKSKFALVDLCRSKVVTAVIQEHVSYERTVAKCYLPDGTDVAGELVKQGLALDWRKFSGGEYRHLEPSDARKKLWRVVAKHQGRFNIMSDGHLD